MDFRSRGARSAAKLSIHPYHLSILHFLFIGALFLPIILPFVRTNTILQYLRRHIDPRVKDLVFHGLGCVNLLDRIAFVLATVSATCGSRSSSKVAARGEMILYPTTDE
jgi:hypothetical protein